MNMGCCYVAVSMLMHLMHQLRVNASKKEEGEEVRIFFITTSGSGSTGKLGLGGSVIFREICECQTRWHRQLCGHTILEDRDCFEGKHIIG